MEEDQLHGMWELEQNQRNRKAFVYHGHTNHGLEWSTDDRVMNLDLEVMMLGTLDIVSDMRVSRQG